MRKSISVLFLSAVFPFFVYAEDSILLSCYKSNSVDSQVIACLDNAYRNSNIELMKIEKQLLSRFLKPDRIENKADGIILMTKANENFEQWRESHCRMIEASYKSDKNQAYLGCLVDTTQEQIIRLEKQINK